MEKTNTAENRVFISWSTVDPRARETAETFRDWFSGVFGNKITFFYSNDIRPGQRPREEIENAINTAQFAFFFLTRRTAKAPWVVYEAGRLRRLVEANNGYFLLTDISIPEFQTLFPPLADYQASPINTSQEVGRIVDTMCNTLGLSATDKLHITGTATNNYPALARSLAEINRRISALPDRYTGLMPYGNNIDCSNNFKMPQIFDEFKNELFMAGINLAFLLDLKAGTTHFKRMLEVLMEDERKKVKLCICDIWQEHIHYAWDKIVLGYSGVTYEGLTEVFQNKESDVYLDTFIKKITGDKYGQITRQLTIKKIEMLGDTFWFVDADEAAQTGVMMLIPMTGQTGHDRAVFFANQRDHGNLFNGYYSLCRAGFDAYGKVLWPSG